MSAPMGVSIDGSTATVLGNAERQFLRMLAKRD
jgi:hypothetical protein